MFYIYIYVFSIFYNKNTHKHFKDFYWQYKYAKSVLATSCFLL